MIVNYKLLNPLRAGALLLAPGMNHGVKDADFEAAVRDYPRIKKLVANGSIVAVLASEQPAPVEPVAGDDASEADELVIDDKPAFAKLKSKEAMAIVAETFDVAVLEELLQGERRSDVKKALKAQLARVEDALTNPAASTASTTES